jgi:CHAT domain-containing protein/tetratricopeptide (TPR) repeat protein
VPIARRPGTIRVLTTSFAVLMCCALTSACSSRPSPVVPIANKEFLALGGTESREWTFSAPANAPIRVRIFTRNVDVRIEVLALTGRRIASADAPYRRMGSETLLIPTVPMGGNVRIRIDGIDHAAARGRVQLVADGLPLRTAADRRRLDAVGLDATGCATSSDAERALSMFRQAAELHERNHEHADAGYARLHAAGVAYDTHSRWREAADLARDAARHFEAAGNDALAAFATRVEGAALSAAAASANNTAQRDTLVSAARARLGRAASRLEQLGLDYEAGYAYNYRGISYHDAGERDRATADYQHALALFEAAGDEPAQALSRQSLAQLAHEDGRLEDAAHEFDAALRLIPPRERPEDYAHTLHNSALPLAALGHFDDAIVRHLQAARILNRLGEKQGEARAYHAIGAALRQAGEPARARELLQAAIRLRTQEDAARERAASLTVLGQVELDLGHVDAAVALQREALALVTAPNDRARTLLALAEAHMRSKQTQAARAALEQVTTLALAPGHRFVAQAWATLGSLEAHAGRREAALSAFDRAVSAQRANGSELDLARTLARRAEAHEIAHHASGVLADTSSALDLFDRVGLAGTHGEARAVFLAEQRDVAERRIAALLVAAEDDEAKGDAEQAISRRRDALWTSDRVRARMLDDAVGVIAASDPVSARRNRERLYDLLAGKRARRDRLLESAQPAADELKRLGSDIELLRLELAGLDRPTRGAADVSDRGSASRLEPPSGSVLVEYFIGPRRAWRFTATGSTLSVIELPPPTSLDRDAMSLGLAWRSPPSSRAVKVDGHMPPRLASALLSNLPLPANTSRVVVIPDGTLHAIPLARLAQDTLPALRGIDVIIAPSIRSWLTPSPPARDPQRLMAMIADPIFRRDDPRVTRQRHAAVSVGAGATQVDGKPTYLTRSAAAESRLRRLPATAIEARDVLDLVDDPTQAVVLMGADASRDRLANETLADFRIVHFATHAWADNEDPALAALALSAWDTSGQPFTRSLLRLHDIDTLHLAADLVVLSACETGAGRVVVGEGPVSLSQGFLRSGARAVLATLWAVPDSSTAALMREFYEQLLRERRSPSVALRLAQDRIRAIQRWSDPYYWAGFQVTAVGGATVET